MYESAHSGTLSRVGLQAARDRFLRPAGFLKTGL
jgi:hypothetical protein